MEGQGARLVSTIENGVDFLGLKKNYATKCYEIF